MEDLLQTVRDLKTKAKNRRDLKRYESGISFLEQAIQALEPALANTTVSDLKSRLASELADCYGLEGGIYRRWGLNSPDSTERTERLEKSFNAYNKGYQEYEASGVYKIANSYNQLNRLVSYLLFNPASLSDTAVHLPDGQSLSVKKELEKAGESIRQQLMSERRGDIWALADLALINLLLDRETPISAYADFIAASPPDYAFDSALAVLRPLAALQLPTTAKLNEAIQLLEANLQSLRN